MDRRRLLQRVDEAWLDFKESHAGLSDSEILEPGEPGAKRRWTTRRRIPEKSLTESRPLPTPLTEGNRSRGRQSLRAPTSESLPPLPGNSTAYPKTVGMRNTTEDEARLSDKHLLTAVLAGLEPITRTTFLRTIVPALRNLPAEVLARRVGLSVPYCAKIRAGGCAPASKHWDAFRQCLLAGNLSGSRPQRSTRSSTLP